MLTRACGSGGAYLGSECGSHTVRPFMSIEECGTDETCRRLMPDILHPASTGFFPLPLSHNPLAVHNRDGKESHLARNAALTARKE